MGKVLGALELGGETVAIELAGPELAYERFTREEMAAAFKAVEHPGNWKFPGGGWIKAEKLEVTRHAVGFFAGSELEIKERAGSMVRVAFKGYYKCVGA